MFFNSWEFVLFFSAIVITYHLLPSYRYQNWVLLLSSYYFYSAWDWRFLSLIIISTVVDYIVGLKIYNSSAQNHRRLLLTISICTNLGILGFFKYFNFFLDGLHTLFNSLGTPWMISRIDIILPVGISFYTFQTMSYTIDIYRKKLEPTRNILDFALFVAFFPQLVAGPIERAKTLLPQISRRRTVTQEQLVSGFWLIFWGLYKKIVIADNLAAMSDQVFSSSASVSVLGAYLGVLAFTIQIYCDFSGYSDIARGCARIMGIELMRNFNLPYFAKNPKEFWQRWHISLSTWLRDYLYISLGGNRKGDRRTHFNLFVTMVLGGLWHGASWNFVWWGTYNGLLLITHRLYVRWKNNAESTIFPFINTVIMFQFTLFGWLLFRSTRKVVDHDRVFDDSLNQIIEMILSFRNGSGFNFTSLEMFLSIVMYSTPLLFVQWFQYQKQDHYFMLKWSLIPVTAIMYGVLAFTWLLWGVQTGESFIYFQF
jgi:alginate O-acetyltransferase complex protein AlgI